MKLSDSSGWPGMSTSMAATKVPPSGGVLFTNLFSCSMQFKCSKFRLPVTSITHTQQQHLQCQHPANVRSVPTDLLSSWFRYYDKQLPGWLEATPAGWVALRDACSTAPLPIVVHLAYSHVGGIAAGDDVIFDVIFVLLHAHLQD